MTASRRAFTITQLLLGLAVTALLFALLVPGIARARFAADRRASEINLKQIGIALHSYHDANGLLPPGNDDNNFSAFARLLPYIEEGNLYNKVNFMKPMDDKANADARKTIVKIFLNSADKAKPANAEYGSTNYLLNAGAKPALADNNGLCYQNSKVKLSDVTDGLSNTMMAGETLRGDGAAKATTVKRQHVLLTKDDLKDIKDEAGVKDWKDNKNIAGDRGASWMDGRFLQSTFTGTRVFNDEKPDVNCAGLGGLSALRSDEESALVLIADGSVRTVKATTKLDVWKALAGRNDGTALPEDF
jgi:type II secretory pathway pseudopilin PulG